MFRIHAAPRALLAMFGMKNEGRNPPDMPETIQCTADVLDNYLEQWFGGLVSPVTTIVAPTSDSNLAVTLTNGFMWRVWGVGQISVVAAGDIANDSIHLLDLVTSGGAIVPLAAYTWTINNQLRQTAFWFPRPIILRPGVGFRSYVAQAGVVTGNWTNQTVVYAQAVPE